MKHWPALTLIIFSVLSCGRGRQHEEIDMEEIIESTVLTAGEQAALTPNDVIRILKEGNLDFMSDNLTVRNNSQRVRDAAMGQYPKAVILSCLDSRVPVEDVFHRGIGDIFVARVAGNISNDDILGSLEYACRVSGAKLVMVLGHEHCRAVKSAIDDVELGNITSLLEKIKPAVDYTRSYFEGEASSKNEDFVEAVCYSNVALTVNTIRDHSPILRDMERNGEIRIIGGVYEMHTGRVDFLEDL